MPTYNGHCLVDVFYHKIHYEKNGISGEIHLFHLSVSNLKIEIYYFGEIEQKKFFHKNTEEKEEKL